MASIGTRLTNPLWHVGQRFFGANWAFTTNEKYSNLNCLVYREAVRKYVEKRKSGEAQSKVGNNSDMLSLFLENQDVFTTEVIIDELTDFIIAGT